jgi:serine/threonine protein kinase
MVFLKGDQILKLSQPNFPNNQYQIGETECSILQDIANKTNIDDHFPSCLGSSKVWFEGAEKYATLISFLEGEPFDTAVEKSSPAQLYQIVEDLINVLEIMNNIDITHRDIDTRNVIVKDMSSIRVFDFALATSQAIPAQGETVYGLGLHKPPDVLLCGYDDVYSAGTMLRNALVKRGGTVPRGIHNLVYHMTRHKCTDRIRDFPRLRGILTQYGLVTDKVAPCYDANAYVQDTSIQHVGECLLITGYQKYEVCTNSIVRSEDEYLNSRLQGFEGINLKGKTLLDIGGNSGFYSLWALQHGVLSSKIIEQDADAIAVGELVADFLSKKVSYITFKKATEADVVVAFGIIHWLVSCSEAFGSLEEVVYYLRTLTRSHMLIEWIDPLDDAIQGYGHIDPSLSFSKIKFEMLLKQYFSSFEFVSYSRKHRLLYRAIV